MKKFICVLMSIIIAFSCVFVTSAKEDANVDVDGLTETPVVVVSGDGSAIVNKDGEVAMQYKNLLKEEYRDEFIDKILDTLKDLIVPLIVEGFLTDNWDSFYDTLYDGISDIFAETLLDNNGEIPTDPESPAYMSDVEPYAYQRNKDSLEGKYVYDDKYNSNSFVFFYDWRLDPFVTVEKLHDYIQGVKELTGSNKVGLIGRCLGSSIVATYVKVYGMEDLNGVAFNGSVVNGAEILSESISGGFEVDMNAIIRFMQDADGVGLFSIDQIVIDVLDLLQKSGVYTISKEIAEATIYKKLVEGVTSSLALSTFFTFPTYWTAVTAEEYQDALYYVFGPEGSEKRQEYAGLIAKLDHYDREVRQQLQSIYETIDREGNLGIMSKYDFQIIPITKSYEKLGDQFASVEYTSVGATTMDIYSTFSDEYIAQQEAKGLGKYISPDKKIDASTCSYPDYTWFVKGSSHSNWSFIENALLMEVVSADKQITVDDTIYTQFMVYDYDKPTEMQAMTTENCDKVFHEADKEYDKPETFLGKVRSLCKSLVKLIKSILGTVQENNSQKSV